MDSWPPCLVVFPKMAFMGIEPKGVWAWLMEQPNRHIALAYVKILRAVL